MILQHFLPPIVTSRHVKCKETTFVKKTTTKKTKTYTCNFLCAHVLNLRKKRYSHQWVIAFFKESLLTTGVWHQRSPPALLTLHRNLTASRQTRPANRELASSCRYLKLKRQHPPFSYAGRLFSSVCVLHVKVRLNLRGAGMILNHNRRDERSYRLGCVVISHRTAQIIPRPYVGAKAAHCSVCRDTSAISCRWPTNPKYSDIWMRFSRYWNGRGRCRPSVSHVMTSTMQAPLEDAWKLPRTDKGRYLDHSDETPAKVFHFLSKSTIGCGLGWLASCVHSLHGLYGV